MGIMGMESDRRLDGRGRVTLPQSVRHELGLDPGDEVTVTLKGGRIVVWPASGVARRTIIESMEGCITAETRREGAPPMEPLELDRDWTSDLSTELRSTGHRSTDAP